jgi:hypothetical protein
MKGDRKISVDKSDFWVSVVNKCQFQISNLHNVSLNVLPGCEIQQLSIKFGKVYKELWISNTK